MTHDNKLQVEAIKRGTVIDHIPAQVGFKLLTLFKLTETDQRITIGLNLPSGEMGRKDLIKIENTFLTDEQVNQLSLYAPDATVNRIDNYDVVGKSRPSLPERIESVQGVDLGSMIITSGQIPVNPKTGEVPADVAAQARQSLENVQAIVESAGLKVGDIVKTTVFVKDLNDFATVNATYEAFFTEHNASFPARSCVEVARLPKDVKIEIEAIAVRR